MEAFFFLFFLSSASLWRHYKTRTKTLLDLKRGATERGV